MSLEKATGTVSLKEGSQWRLKNAQQMAKAIEKAGFKTGYALFDAQGMLTESDGERVFIIGGTGEVCRLKATSSLQKLASLGSPPDREARAVIKIDNVNDGIPASMELVDFRFLELKLAPSQ
jgi:hypothetical protein